MTNETVQVREAIKPCPVCGSDMELCHSHTEGVSQYLRHVPQVGGHNCPIAGVDDFNIDGDLVEVWNSGITRHAEQARSEEGALRAALIAERDRMHAAYHDFNLSEANRHGAFQATCALNRVLDAPPTPQVQP